MKPTKILTSKPENFTRISSFLINAYEDYISARTLINLRQLRNGTMLATTSIEKYFKAIFSFRNSDFKFSHNVGGATFLNSLRNYVPQLYSKINLGFLKYLSKAYELRYVESLPKGYQILLFQNKTLVELDHMVGQLEPFIKIDTPGFKGARPFEKDLRMKRAELMHKNVFLRRTTREDLFSLEEHIHLVKVNEEGIPIEFSCDLEKGKDDQDFSSEGPFEIMDPETGKVHKI